MKTSFSFKLLVMALFAATSMMSVNAGAAAPEDYVKNDKVENGMVIERLIFINNDGALERHIRYQYTYDSENRPKSKQAEKWNTVSEAWEPYFKLDMNYQGQQVEVTYARWNKKSKAYDKDIQKTSYQMNDGLMEQLMASR